MTRVLLITAHPLPNSFNADLAAAYRAGAERAGATVTHVDATALHSRWVATMDSPALWYWLAHHDALGGSFGRGTLSYVGFGPIHRELVFNVRKLSKAQRERWVARLDVLGAQDGEARQPRALPARPAPLAP